MRFRTAPILLTAAAFLGGQASAQLALNEIYASHAGIDTEEFIEIVGPPGTSLLNHFVLVVEGQFPVDGTVDRVFDLSAYSIGPSGYFTLGNTSVGCIDLDVGSQDSLENGTETFYLVVTQNPQAVQALIGVDADPDGDGLTTIPTVATILDIVGMLGTGATDVIFDNAPVIGPDPAGPFFPAGIFRTGDFPNPWCTDVFLDFDPIVNMNLPRTPCGPNSTCAGGAIGTPICFGDGSGAPCPCGNETAGGSGCANTTGGGGVLSATGMADTTADTVVLSADGVINQPGLFFQGNNVIGGGAGTSFGDGIRCCGQSVVRIQVVNPPGTASPATATSSVAISAQGPAGTVNPGDTKCYQYWYRDPAGGGVCGSSFNLSNALTITWM